MMRPLPSYDDLRVAPELATLTVLDAALAVARTSLLAENPDIGDLGHNSHAAPPPLCTMIASLLVARLEELDDLLAWYRVAVDDLRRRRGDDAIF
jgi:hypothetical protein